jgi:hypothetical protein
VWLANGMSVPPLPGLDALSLDELKKLVVQLLVRVSALEEENRQLRAENARLKDLPKKPTLAPGGMDKATEPDKRARTKQARRQRRKRQSGRRTPPVTTERTRSEPWSSRPLPARDAAASSPSRCRISSWCRRSSASAASAG